MKTQMRLQPKEKAPSRPAPIPSGKTNATPLFQFVDNRPATVLQRKLQELLSHRTPVMLKMPVQRMEAPAEEEAVGHEEEAPESMAAEHEEAAPMRTDATEPVQMMPKHVQNLEGTSKRKCKCTGLRSKTWMGHWGKHTGQNLRVKCRAARCPRWAQVGAHVSRIGHDGRVGYIVPFCQKHNKRPRTQILRLKKESPLAPSSMGTCN